MPDGHQRYFEFKQESEVGKEKRLPGLRQRGKLGAHPPQVRGTPAARDGPPIPTGYRARTVAEVRGPERPADTREQHLVVYGNLM